MSCYICVSYMGVGTYLGVRVCQMSADLVRYRSSESNKDGICVYFLPSQQGRIETYLFEVSIVVEVLAWKLLH